MTNEEINAIYDSFNEKDRDMTRATFHREMNRLTDPKAMVDEANQIAQGEIAKKRINRSLN